MNAPFSKDTGRNTIAAVNRLLGKLARTWLRIRSEAPKANRSICIFRRPPLGRSRVFGRLLYCAVTALLGWGGPSLVLGQTVPSAAKGVSPAHEPAVVVNGTAITVLDVFLELNRLIPQESYHGNVKATEQRALTKKALRNAIVVELAAQAARKKGMQLSRAELEAEFARRARDVGGEAQLLKLLKTLDLSRAEYDRNIDRDILAARFVAQDYGRAVVISDADLKKYYDGAPQRFVLPEAVRLSLVEVRVDPSAPATRGERRRVAEGLRKLLVSKAIDFGDTARKFSGHESAARGGDLGWLHRGSLGSEIEGPAFASPVGEVSPIVENLYGFNIFVVTEKRGARQLGFAEIDKEYWRTELKRTRQREQLERGEERLLAGVVIAAGDAAIDKVMRSRFGTR